LDIKAYLGNDKFELISLNCGFVKDKEHDKGNSYKIMQNKIDLHQLKLNFKDIHVDKPV